ncbi:MAG: VOC family protein [Nocardioidaceae bacterium]
MTDKSYVPEWAGVVTPYLCVRDCAKAIDWYADVFGAVEMGERYVEQGGRIGHAALAIDGDVVMLSDSFPDFGAEAPPEGNRTTSYALNVYVPDVDATMAKAEAAGAFVQAPAEDQPYGSRMGKIFDPFGVRWMIATHQG